MNIKLEDAFTVFNSKKLAKNIIKGIADFLESYVQCYNNLNCISII